MEDKIYSFHLYASCEDVKTNSKFSYSIATNSFEIKVYTSNGNDYTITPDKILEVEQRLKDQLSDNMIRNLKFQNKVNVKIEDGQYKIVRDEKT